MSANPQFPITRFGTQFMEHRWGTRVELDVLAELRTLDGLSIPVRVRNASLSGAFVETATRLPPLARLSLRPLVGAGEWLEACVVRVDIGGMGLGWLEPGLHSVAALLATRRDVSAADMPLRHGNVHPLLPQPRGNSR